MKIVEFMELWGPLGVELPDPRGNEYLMTHLRYRFDEADALAMCVTGWFEKVETLQARMATAFARQCRLARDRNARASNWIKSLGWRLDHEFKRRLCEIQAEEETKRVRNAMAHYGITERAFIATRRQLALEAGMTLEEMPIELAELRCALKSLSSKIKQTNKQTK